MAELVQDLPIGFAEALRNWREVLRTGNLSADRRADVVSRWLIMTRASVFPMTLTSGLIGGLLAAGAPEPNWACFALALAGLVSAHACNNLMNDYFDVTGGVDTAASPRALYAPHPILAGWVSERGLVAAIAAFNAFGALVLWAVFQVRGWPAVAFAAAGFLVSFFYVAPPIRLKHHGLGEPAVFVVWGPLMIAGTYFVTTGELPGWVWAASVPYAILVTTVLIGKHIDKLAHDEAKGIHTLPVLLGERASLRLNRTLMISFFPAVGLLIVSGVFGLWAVLVVGSLPLLRKVLGVYSRPRPDRPPAGYPIWPLWYVAAAFVFTRRAGALLVLGLVLDRIVPLTLG